MKIKFSRLCSYLALIVFLTTGCATVPLATPELDMQAKKLIPSKDECLIYIYRTNQLQGIANLKKIVLNGNYIGELAPGSYFLVEDLPGVHSISKPSAFLAPIVQISVSCQAGQVYFVRLFAGGFGRWAFKLVDESTGRKEIASSKLVKSVSLSGDPKPAPVAVELDPDDKDYKNALKIDEKKAESMKYPYKFESAISKENYPAIESGKLHRKALVIGNSSYRFAPLPNPVNDAADISNTLKDLGFQVRFLYDADRRSMEEAINVFHIQLRSGGVGLFYYAGHGVQVNGENYLIPIGSNIEREADVKYEAVPVGKILGSMEDARNQLNIVILDACRNNPYKRSWRSAGRGLAPIQAMSGSLIAYATAPGSVASDGKGRNGPYTNYLLKFMKIRGLSIEEMFKMVRISVIDETDGKQTPWESSSLTGDFYFAGK